MENCPPGQRLGCKCHKFIFSHFCCSLENLCVQHRQHRRHEWNGEHIGYPPAECDALLYALNWNSRVMLTIVCVYSLGTQGHTLCEFLDWRACTSKHWHSNFIIPHSAGGVLRGRWEWIRASHSVGSVGSTRDHLHTGQMNNDGRWRRTWNICEWGCRGEGRVGW